jgi:hypothetical protein
MREYSTVLARVVNVKGAPQHQRYEYSRYPDRADLQRIGSNGYVVDGGW